MKRFAQKHLPNTPIKIIISEKASNAGEAFYQGAKNLIVIAPEVCLDLSYLEGTLLHELGHAQHQYLLPLTAATIDVFLSCAHGLLAILILKTGSSPLLLGTFLAGIFNTIIMSNLLLTHEEHYADCFAAKNCSTREVLEKQYKNYKEAELRSKKKLKKHRAQLLNLSTSLYKKIKALRFFFDLYRDIHPWDEVRAKFFKQSIRDQFSDSSPKTRHKPLAEFIHEELNPLKKKVLPRQRAKENYQKKYRQAKRKTKHKKYK